MTSEKDPKTESSDLRDTAYKDKVEAELDQLKAEIDKLKARAKEASADQRLKYDEYIDKLDERREDVKERLSTLSDASGDAWDEVKAGMRDAWQRLAIAKKAAEARFEEKA